MIAEFTDGASGLALPPPACLTGRQAIAWHVLVNVLPEGLKIARNRLWCEFAARAIAHLAENPEDLTQRRELRILLRGFGWNAYEARRLSYELPERVREEGAT